MTAVSPCVHPRCDDGTGNPKLTTQTMCDSCRARFRRDLDFMRDDYDWLRANLPKPDGSDLKTRSTATFTRPSEWASNESSLIARILEDAEVDVRVALDEDKRIDRTAAEAARVRQAWVYLDARFDTLSTFQYARIHAEAMGKKHAELRHALGYTRRIQMVDHVACFSCGALGQIAKEGEDVWCKACGRRITQHIWLLMLRHEARSRIEALRLRRRA